MGKLINSIAEIYKKQDETGVIMADTVLLACGCTPADIETFANHGIKEVPAVLEQRVKFDDLSDETLISNLFKLEQDDLDQLPISFFSEIAKSEALKNLSHDSQTTVFNKIFHTIGIESLQDLQNTEAEKVAYNHKEYKAIFDAFFSFNYKEQAKEVTQYFDQIVDQKLDEVLDKAPELTNNSEKRNEITQLNEKHNGNLMEASEEALSLFEDTKELKKENLQGLGLDKNFEQYSVNTAKAALAQYKLGAYAEAAKAKGLINEATAEKYSVVNPAEKDNPVNKFVNAAKNTMANFAKPQSLAKIGFRTLATKMVTKAAQHVFEGAVPGIGAAVGLAAKLLECGNKIFKDKRKASEVFKEAAPDLVRGVVTVGTSFTPLAAIAGPIGTVASVVTRGIQGAHQEGLKVGKGFFKRVLSEFKKKGNAINLASSVIGAGIGFASKEFMEHMNEGEELEAELINETQTAPEMEVTNGVVNDDLQAGNGATGVTAQGAAVEPTLSYVEQYIKDHPGAHLDKNGWLQNADGSYARNDKGQLFGSEDRVFRDLRENEMLDKHGNIVEKVGSKTIEEPEVKADFSRPTVQETEVLTGKTTNQDLNEYQAQARKLGTHIDHHERTNDTDPRYVEVLKGKKAAYEILGNPNSTEHDRQQALAQIDAMNAQKREWLREEYFGYEPRETAQETVNLADKTNNNYELSSREREMLAKELAAVEKAKMQENFATDKAKMTADFGKTQTTIAEQKVEKFVESDNQRVEELKEKYLGVQEGKVKVGNEYYDKEEFKRDPLPARSQEELAKIDAAQSKAEMMQNFNSLPEEQQRELIDIKARANVAKERGDNAAYAEFKKEFDSKFKEYVAEDKRLDAKNRTADMRFNSEEHQRRDMLVETATGKHTAYRIVGITPEEAQELLRKEFGGEVVNGKFVRDDGGLDVEVGKVPDKNFTELGYQQQADGTWIKGNAVINTVVTDINKNGLYDEGDVFERNTNFGSLGGSYYESGTIKSSYEEIDANRNAQTELKAAMDLERAKLNRDDIHNEKVDELVNSVGSESIRKQILENEAKKMQEFEDYLETRRDEFAADGVITKEESAQLLHEQGVYLSNREQNLADAIQANGYSAQPTKDVNGSVIQGYQDPTVAPATTEVEKAVEINEPAIEAQFTTREAFMNQQQDQGREM